MRTANPALNDAAFQHYSDYADDSRMTLNGPVNKTGFLLLLAIVPAVWIWQQVYEGAPGILAALITFLLLKVLLGKRAVVL